MMDTLTKATMGVLLVAATPVGGDPSAWAQWGLAGVIVGFTLWRDTQRERRMSQALEKHQLWVQTTLLNAMEHNTIAMERLTSVRLCPLQSEKRDGQ